MPTPGYQVLESLEWKLLLLLLLLFFFLFFFIFLFLLIISLLQNDHKINNANIDQNHHSICKIQSRQEICQTYKIQGIIQSTLQIYFLCSNSSNRIIITTKLNKYLNLQMLKKLWKRLDHFQHFLPYFGKIWEKDFASLYEPKLSKLIPPPHLNFTLSSMGKRIRYLLSNYIHSISISSF